MLHFRSPYWRMSFIIAFLVVWWKLGIEIALWRCDANIQFVLVNGSAVVLNWLCIVMHSLCYRNVSVTKGSRLSVILHVRPKSTIYPYSWKALSSVGKAWIWKSVWFRIYIYLKYATTVKIFVRMARRSWPIFGRHLYNVLNFASYEFFF